MSARGWAIVGVLFVIEVIGWSFPLGVYYGRQYYVGIVNGMKASVIPNKAKPIIKYHDVRRDQGSVSKGIA